MLYWICPECGGECSPAVRECPVCAGASAVPPVSAGPPSRNAPVTEQVIALVHNLQPAAQPVFPPAVLSPPSLPAANGFGNGHSMPAATLDLPDLPELPPEEELSAPAKEALDSLVRPLIESTTLMLPPEAPSLRPSIQTAPQPAAMPQAVEAAPPDMPLQAESVLETVDKEKIAAQIAIRGIVASFQQQPKMNLLGAAVEQVAAPAPVCLKWMDIPRPQLRPVGPSELDHGQLLSGVQTPPLAGPCVPHHLRNLTEQRTPASALGRKKASLPAWTVSFIVALALFLAAGSLLQHVAASRDPNAPVSPASDDSTSDTSSAQAASKLVEVTGLRIATGSNRRPQLEFIVVNHSAVPLSDVGLNIAVRSASSQSGVAPLFRVSTTIPSLGAYQSREFRAELGPEVHATDVPDWQSLRADVRINQ